MSEQEPIRPDDKEAPGSADARVGSEMQENGVPTFRLEERGSGEAVAPATATEKWANLPEDLRAPWGWLDLLFLALFWLVVQFAAGITVGVVAVSQGMEVHQLSQLARNPRVVVALTATMFVLLMVFVCVLLRVRYESPFWRAVGWRRWPAGKLSPAVSILLSLLGGVGLALVVIPMNAVFKSKTKMPIEELFQDRPSALLLMGLAILLAPLVEETIFRGYIYPVIARSWGVTAAVLVTGVAFGLLHAQQLRGGTAQIVMLIWVGIVLTWVRAKTGTVLASYLVHLSYNSFLFLGLYAATGGFRRFPTAGG